MLNSIPLIHSHRILYILAVLLTAMWSSKSLATNKVVDIAVITDGPSLHTDMIKATLREELQSLAGSAIKVSYPSQLQTNGDWSVGTVQKALDKAIANPSTDIVVMMGVIGSSLTAKLNPKVPVLAPFIIDRELQQFPITAKGTSGVKNLHYLSIKRNIRSEILQFQKATESKHMALLAEPRVLSAIPAAQQTLDQLAKNLGFKFSVVSTNPSASETLAAIPNDTDAVFVLPLMTYNPSELQQLIDGLNNRRLPSYGTTGRSLVEQGMLMGAALVPPPERIARQLAIDISDIIRGRDAGNLPVAFDSDNQLVVNLETARKINYSPPFEVLFEAELLHEENQIGRQLTLDRTVQEALERNLELALANQRLLSSGQSTRIAKSSLLPQLTLGANSQAFDRDLVGTGATRSTSAGLTLSQVLYSESAHSNYTVAKHLEGSQSADLDRVRLDIIQLAARAYLNVLVAKTQVKIQRENLQVTRSNLERAQFRYKVGATDRSEVHRFETTLGGNRQDVSNAEAAYRQSRNQLNQILQQPIESPFQTQEPGLTDPRLFGDERLGSFITNPNKAKIFHGFLVQESLNNSPELESIRQQIAAQERTLLATKRVRYIPDVSLTGNVDKVVDDHGAKISTPHDEDWSVNVQFTLPLYAGSRLDADRQQAEIELRRLRLQQQQITDQVETSVRTSVHQTGASKINIRFAKDAADAAVKTLALVTDAYTRGTASYIDLIDAQNAALVAQLSSANAVYQFLLDLMDVQRAIGFFDFFVEPQDKEAWFQRLDAYASSQQQGISP